MSRIRISGGPHSTDIKVHHVNDDGSEVELTGITSITVNPIDPFKMVAASITFLNVELDLVAEVERSVVA